VTWTTLWLFAATETILSFTPGPAVLFVLSSALRLGARQGPPAILAILAANTIYFALSATGIGALLASSYQFFFAAKWLGAAYLVYLGARAILGHHSVVPTQEHAEQHAAIPTGAWRLFADGLVLQLSNPKAIVFFSAILPQFINPRHAVLPQVVILALTSTICELIVLCGYGIAASRASLLARQPRYAMWTNRIAGALLISAGTGLALLRRE
jgi:threonine/homoserine/homoserine lactone efflux protein